MDILFKTRNLYPEELRFLKTLKTKEEKEGRKIINIYHYFISGIIGAVLTYITTIIPESILTLLFGTTAVFAFAFIVFTPYEKYKKKRKNKILIKQLDIIINKGTIDTCIINTKRIALAPEYEDENDLYIIEISKEEILYLWDTEYKINKIFPCFDFEIYEETFFKISGRQIYPLSDKILPEIIDKKAKWNFMKHHKVPGHLEIERVNFNELLEKYNKYA